MQASHVIGNIVNISAFMTKLIKGFNEELVWLLLNLSTSLLVKLEILIHWAKLAISLCMPHIQ